MHTVHIRAPALTAQAASKVVAWTADCLGESQPKRDLFAALQAPGELVKVYCSGKDIIYATRKPGGRLVLVGFERIPGQSREFIGHK